MSKKVFLGGTCNNSEWRKEMIPLLRTNKLDFFNPVVEDWNEEAQANELRERENCDYCLYTITPRMLGVYSIAEVVDDSNKRPKKTILVLLRHYDEIYFPASQWKSLVAVAKMVAQNGGQAFYNLEAAATTIAILE